MQAPEWHSVMPLPEHIQALLQTSIYPHSTDRIHLLETHISWVILTGTYAYKIKKPLNLGFLDFSTLAKRRYYCCRELELNRRFAPDLYLDVLPVSRTHTGYHLGDTENVVDYCLKMQQFDPQHLLIERLRNGVFNTNWMDMLARDIARFHASASTIYRTQADDCLWQHIKANLDTAQQHIPDALTNRQYEQLYDDCHDRFRQCRQWLRQRQDDGFVRDCHGDLHLRNITLINDIPVPFDCIEFNDSLREIDVLNDAAFLLMDCDANKRPDLGYRFLSRYLEHSGDYAGLNVLPLYLCYRASVRGKVACILADEQSSEQRNWQQARLYFALAGTYLHRPKPTLFVIGGPSGSGKSHLSLLGCGPEHAVIIRSDATRQRLATRFPDLERYGHDMHIRTYNAMFDAARDVLTAGFSVILDATFLHADSRQRAQQLAEDCSVPLCGYWLDVPKDRLRENIRRRQQYGHDISEADIRVLELQLQEYQRPSEHWWKFITSASCWPGTPRESSKSLPCL